MVVHHWYVGDQRHVVFEANDDLEAGAELHFNYFLHERNLAAKEKQFRSWGGCACGAAECEGSIINDTALWMNEVGVEDGSSSRDFILAGSPGVDVLEQLGHHPRESVCVRDISGDVLLVDEGAPARGLMQWGLRDFCAGTFLTFFLVKYPAGLWPVTPFSLLPWRVHSGSVMHWWSSIWRCMRKIRIWRGWHSRGGSRVS